MSTFDAFSEPNETDQAAAMSPALQKITRRETIVDVSTVLVWIVASDVLLYHSAGYSAWAVFLSIAAAVLLLARRNWSKPVATIATLCLIAACCVRLAWCGSWGAITAGVGLIVALSMCVNGSLPYLPDMSKYLVHVLVGSGFRLSQFSFRNARNVVAHPKARYGVLLPLVVVSAFSIIFVMANPDVVRWLETQFAVFTEQLGQWVEGMDPFQLVFWILSGWLALGLIYPAADYLIRTAPETAAVPRAPSDNYVAVRNMMISVVLLFALYLAFEFTTLWNREFPKGFYYAGYAHEGAFWLTVALALATLVLSLAFRGSVTNDPRVDYLRCWAWVWSAENLLLGLAVVHRMFIYIDFNGMTRMRVVGLLGTTAVIVGFGLVVYKIVRGRGFSWLIRQQLWTVALAMIVYAIGPVDYVVQRYNAAQIESGNPAPCTQIPTHETSAEGLIPLISLLDTPNAVIRVGIEATLADWLVNHPPAEDWRDNQWAHGYLRERLQEHLPQLQILVDNASLRQTALDGFYNYAYQWY